MHPRQGSGRHPDAGRTTRPPGVSYAWDARVWRLSMKPNVVIPAVVLILALVAGVGYVVRDHERGRLEEQRLATVENRMQGGLHEFELRQ